MNIDIHKSKYLLELYNNLENIISNTYIDKLNIKVNEIKCNPREYLFDSDFTSANISNHILKNLIYSYKFEYDNNTIIYFCSKKIKNINNPPDIIIKMFYIIVIIKKLYQRKHNQKLIFFETNLKKIFPKNNFKSKPKILNADNINTALTFVVNNKNGDIILYRKEECIKVLIHELIHSNCIDYNIIFSKNSKLFSNLFCSNYQVLLNECFTETIACIINVYYIYITGIYKMIDSNLTVNKMLYNECVYSNYICSKIKTYYGINKISNIIKNKCTEQFPQQTNVLSYYFLKNILLNDIIEFDLLLYKYKITDEIFIRKLIKLIIDNINKIDKRIYDINDNNNSLKMSYYEVFT